MAAPRVRFCPAPSGWLHVGSARTALYNWLHARGSGGTYVLRIEDTDANRATAESMHGMLDSLRWLGLDWDEGPEVGGDHGPYVQSERLALHQAVARRLLEGGHAYEAFETPEELEADRARAEAAGLTPGYSGAHRDLGEDEKAALRAEGRRPVLRLRTPDDGVAAFDDAVRGRIEVAWADVTDFVVQRADGSPTYYLANTVDDLAQGITLVARGEDLLSATPRQLLLVEALLAGHGAGAGPGGHGAGPGGHAAGPDDLIGAALAEVSLPPPPAALAPPTYAHLPIIVGEDRKKLSKRHGSVAIDEYRRQGFLPEVVLNFLALCGWSYDDRTERFTVPELIEKFSLQRVGRNPAFFDPDKLRALNGDRVKELPPEELAERLLPYFAGAGLVGAPASEHERALVRAFAPLLQERVQTLAEAPALVAFAFRAEVVYDDAAVAKHLKGRAGEVLDAATPLLADLEPWTGEAILEAFDGLCDRLGLGRGKVMQPVRVAVTGTAVSPPLPETLAVLDRDLVVGRLREARRLVAA